MIRTTPLGQTIVVSMVAVSRLNWNSYFPTLTFRSFLSHYLPASGALSHTLFAVHIFNPTFVSRIFTTKDLAVSNSILFTANLGLGFYMYYRRHLHRLKKWDRVELSVISATMFNFGSLLAAVLIKSLIPQKTPTWTRCLFGSALSVYLLSRAYKYLLYIDEQAVAKSLKSTPRSLRSPVVHIEKNGKLSNHSEGMRTAINVHDVSNDGDESSGYGTLGNGASLTQ
ncbi:hypothetical protein Angca_001125 [Angiostrongylus cantonensis]|nr:hypothetical protein Angca_001125 [Angiostrongylus cantonensis]